MNRVNWMAVAMCVLLGCAGRTIDGGSNDPGGSADAGGSGPTCDMTLGAGSAAFDSGGAPCNFTYTGCSDGRTYAVDCPSAPAPCSCRIDDAGSGQFDAAICGLPPSQIRDAINQGCGWNLQ